MLHPTLTPPPDPNRIGFFSAKKAMDNPTVLTPLSDLPRVPHNFYINVLAVLLGPRTDARKTRKKDYYIQEVSSLLVSGRRRKTVLSVWRDQDAFAAAAKPGNVLAIYGAAVNKNYEEDVVNKVLKLVPAKVPHGHLNVYNSNPAGWFVVDPVGVAGYGELVEWRDGVLAQEICEEVEEMERRRWREVEERERADREFEVAEMEKRREMEERARIGEAESRRREKAREEREDEEVARMEKEGMIWWRDGKPFWKVDGLY